MNLEQPTITKNFEAPNYIYAGGQGEGAARVIKTASDTAAMGYSVFNRIELFQDATNAKTDDAVQAEAYSTLLENRWKINMSGKIIDTDGCMYGVDYRFGDKVIFEYEGEAHEAHIDAIHVTVERGVETVDNHVSAIWP